MNIAFFGSSLVSAYWNGAATYYRGLLRALSRRGHAITFYEPDAFERQSHRDIADPEWARVVVYAASETGVGEALDDARGTDIIVKASGVGVFDDLLAEAVLDTRRPGALAVYWDVDAPATLDLLRRETETPLAALIPHYDLVFTYGGGDRVVAEYLSHGARACTPIYNALDPETHFPVPAQARFAADLSFVGNRLPDREARVAAFFFEAARLSPERRFLLGGNGWQDCALPANVDAIGHVYTGDHNALNCSALAVLNINRESMADFGFSPPTRVFEAAGAGACLITDAWPGIEFFLEPEEEVLIAKDGAEIAALLAALTPERARRIGARARRRILAGHTYEERARIVEETLMGATVAPGKVA